MKITKKVVFLLLACLFILSPICLATSDPVTTSDDSTKNTPNSKVTSILNTDLYLFDQDVVVEDAVNGNVFAAGSTVTVKGEILGDLFVFGNSITIEEDAVIYGNVFALANSMVVKGSIQYDIYALSQDFELANSGYVNRDVKLYVGTAKLNGIIMKNANLIANNIIMPEDAKNLIGEDLNYTSTQESNIPEGAVLGEINYTEYKEKVYTTSEIILNYIIKFITAILYAIVVILLATYLTPKFIEKSSYTLMKRPFVSAGIGIFAIVLIPVIAIILLTTGVLSYISMAVLAIYALVLSITLPIFSMAIAKSIEKKLKNPSKAKFILFSVLVAIVLWLLQIIPYIGGYISLFIYVVGLGVAIFAFFIRKDVNEVNNSK